MSKIYGKYGEFCATHPWEVIVAVITITTSLLTLEKHHSPIKPPKSKACIDCNEAANVVFMTIVRCLAILYSYHQFRNLQKLGSKYILGIAGLFIVFASFVFISSVFNILQIEVFELKDALFFFLLMIDLSKAATLAQFALTAKTKEEISQKIARGMSILGPTITLDSIVETLVIGVGTISGVYRLEVVSYFACLSVIVNFVIFMTFYPACLSLMLELLNITNQNLPVKKLLLEDHEKSNPAVQRVKLIMSLGLLIVHVHSRWFTEGLDQTIVDRKVNCTDTSSFYGYLMKQIQINVDHIVILTLLLTLMIKFIYFESRTDLFEQEKIIELTQSKQMISRCRTLSFNAEVQTDDFKVENTDYLNGNDVCRKLEDCLKIYRSGDGANDLNDREIMMLVDTKHIPSYNLEKAVQNPERGVRIRRNMIQKNLDDKFLINLPYKDYDYSKVMGACCENVIGYIPVPLGVAGPLLLDDKYYYIPMATTEGCLVASTNRGCKAIERCGIKSRIVADGMTRGPVVRFKSITEASAAMLWLKDDNNFKLVKEQFDSTSRFARLNKFSLHIAGRFLFIRFVAETGDAMGMNMLSKGTEKALKFVQEKFPEMELISLSGNICTDKKPAAINWIEGRGKSVVCEAIIPSGIVTSVLKSSTQTLVELNNSKNMIGSAMAGCIGGFNAHAANIVTAVFIATGQDPAQNIGSSNCITIMEPWGENGHDLYISCTMPSLEIGTIGGGTILPPQSACLELLGVKGANLESPGKNARQLARIICGAVLAGELSLMAALATGHLVRSHLKYNRSCSSKDSFNLGTSCDK